MKVTRRDLLKGVAAGSAGLAIGACSSDGNSETVPPDAPDSPVDAPRPVSPPEPVPEVARFELGISAGDLAAGNGVLWTKYTGTSTLVAVAWRVENEAYLEELGPFPATPSSAGFVHVAITGLRAGARYRYTFFELGADGTERIGRSAIGRFRAPIADDAMEKLTLGALCCIHAGKNPDPIQRAADFNGFDAFLFLGDNAYCDGSTRLDGYREDYHEHWSRPAHIALRAATSQYITWDDHEFANNWNPETLDPQQITDAKAVFFEHAPIARHSSSPDRLWRSARWGKTLEIFVLDSRSERKPSTKNTDHAEYLSPEQLAWLKSALAASPAVFKVILNSVPITNMPALWDAGGFITGDTWESFGSQREDLLGFIDANNITGVTWISGDFHLAFISKVGKNGEVGANQHEILCGPGGPSVDNPLAWTLGKPQFLFANATHNHTRLEFDPALRTVEVSYVDGNGEAFHKQVLEL
jgi:alkaline phosphatase D